MKFPKSDHSFIWSASQISDEVVSQIKAIPGVKIWKSNKGCFCPRNAAWLVEAILKARHVWHVVKTENTRIPIRKLTEVEASTRLAYQKEFLLRFGNLRGTIAAHAPGSGKTCTGVTWGLMHAGPCIVVTPAATRLTWAEEIFKWGGKATCLVVTTDLVRYLKEGRAQHVYVNSPDTRFGLVCRRQRNMLKLPPISKIDVTPNFLIVGWESLIHCKEFVLAFSPKSVIFDEPHNYRSPKRAKAIPTYAGDEGAVKTDDGWIKFEKLDNVGVAAHDLSLACERRLALTATPIPDRIKGLWATLDLVEPWCWGRYRSKDGEASFTSRYCGGHEGAFGWEDKGATKQDELKRRLSFIMHVVSAKQTHAHLPPLRFQYVRVPIEDQVNLEDVSTEVTESGVKGVLQRQIMFACSRKRKVVLDDIQRSAQAGTKIIVFTARKADCDFYLKGVKRVCPELTVWMAHGETSTQDRDEIRRQYMNHTGPCVLIGTGQAWGTGLNLQDTDQLFMAMLPYEPAQLEQWIHRVYRLGMVRKPIIKFFIAEDTYDESVEEHLLSKIATVEYLVGTSTQSDVTVEMKKRDEAKMMADLLAATVHYDQEDT